MINPWYIYFSDFDLGTCCACQKTGPTVRTVIELPFKTLQPGTGWGCSKCGLPADGALAVVCDHCLETHAPVQFAVDGMLSDKKRVALEKLTRPFKHNLKKHECKTNLELVNYP